MARRRMRYFTYWSLDCGSDYVLDPVDRRVLGWGNKQLIAPQRLIAAASESVTEVDDCLRCGTWPLSLTLILLLSSYLLLPPSAHPSV
jgi:hypothetical protein